jgi:hypothetical protein
VVTIADGERSKRYARDCQRQGYKLMEKALTGNVSAKPTRQDVLNGLWKLKGETSGGLSQPLTFPKGKPAVPIAGSYEATVKGDKYVSRTGMRAAYCL